MSLKIDVEVLGKPAVATLVRKKAGKPTGDIQQNDKGQGVVKKKKKKKKKGKLPKKYDPKVTPARPCYHRKGKRKKPIGKGTQGAPTSVAPEPDASKTASSPPTPPKPKSAAAVTSSAAASAAASNVIPSRRQKPAGAGGTKKKQQQKKRKGGKGW